MTPEDMKRLEEIRERVEKATEGPWEFYDRYGDLGLVVVENSDADPITDTELRHPGMDHACVRRKDGDFIAHSRQDIPWLLGLVDVLAAANEVLKTPDKETP